MVDIESPSNDKLQYLKEQAAHLMHGDTGAAEQWLNAPAKLLGGITPLQHAIQNDGVQDVLDLIHRMEHGVFS